MDRTLLRKPRHFFDTATRPLHVTFDDGRSRRRNFPWMHYVEARWEYFEPGVVHVLIGDLLIVIEGNNLEPLFAALEEGTLSRIRAQPELAKDREHEPDTFATEIRFYKAEDAPEKGDQFEMKLGA